MKKKIAILSGGDSGEHGISVQSGEVVKKYLSGEKYEVYPILIKGKDWTYTCPHDNVYEIDKNDFSLPMISEKVQFDCVFIAIHGTPGEDGKLQGFLDMMHIPYTTCNHVVSALTFNKHLCKLAVGSLGVNISRSKFITRTDKLNPKDILNGLSLPVFIKPNNGGSSVGMSKVNQPGELKGALQRAFNEDDEALVEEFISGREITCGVFRYNGKIIPLPVTEIISKKEFFDFEAKYNPNLSEEIVPANIPESVHTACRETSVMLYRQLGCRGIVRFDYIFNESGLYFLEVNTVPGMTEASIVPKMARSQGLSLEELFNMLVEEALR